MSIDIGKRVRQARETKGWSQEKLAEEAGTSQTTIDKIERGETKRSRFLPKIAKSLDLDFDEIDPDYLSIGGRGAWLQEEFVKIHSDDKNKIPIYATFPRRDGTFEMVSTPAGYIQRLDSLQFAKSAYALYINNFDMSPEFEPGDVAILNPDDLKRAGSTCLFFKANEPSIIIRRITSFDDDVWHLAKWHPHTEQEILLRAEWPGCHRIVMRQLKD